MDFEKLNVNKMTPENKRSGNIICEDNFFDLSINEKNKWVGVKIKADFKKNNIYIIRFFCEAQVEDMALTIFAFQDKEKTKAKVFTLKKGNNECEFFFTPFDSDEVMFEITSYGKYPPGRIKITDLKISHLFPIKNKEDLKEKIELLGPWYHNFNFDGIETRGNEKHMYRESKWKGILELLSDEIKGKKILDIACNNGWYSINLSKLGADVIGFDISYDYILRGIFAKNILNADNVDLRVGTTNQLDKFENKFDIILCLGYFYHDLDPLQTLKKILKKGKIVVIDNVISNLEYKNGFVKDSSISRDGMIVSNDLLKKTIEKEGCTIMNTIKLAEDRFAFKIKSLDD